MRITALDHIVLNVRDIDVALDFYVDGLGLAPERLDEYRRGEAPFPSVRVDEHTIIDLFPPNMHSADASTAARAANLNHFCLVVDAELGDIAEHVERIGAPVRDRQPQLFGARGMGASVYIDDPDGNSIELRTYRAP